jgi:hypothetical protein
MSQEVSTVTDASRATGAETEVEMETTSAVGTADPAVASAETVAEPGPGASEGGAAVRFGVGFAVGMLAFGVVGVLLNSLPLAMFGGFIVGTLVGIVLAERR